MRSRRRPRGNSRGNSKGSLYNDSFLEDPWSSWNIDHSHVPPIHPPRVRFSFFALRRFFFSNQLILQMIPFRPPMLRPRGMFPIRPPAPPPPLCSSEQNMLLNLLRGIVLPEEDLELLRQMLGRNTRQNILPFHNDNIVDGPSKRPRIDE